ncbi:MAG: lysozyme inhibitor LprI family protein, partial [Dongiaceae bacterium]
KAGNWAEKTICKSDELAALDAWFGPLYGQVAQRLAGKDLDDLKARRKAWLKARNDCKAEADGTACLKTRYQEFTAELEGRFAQLVGGGSGTKGVGVAAAARSPLAECAGTADAPACLEKLIEAEEANLADAEAKAGDAAAQRDQADQNAHLGDRLGEANVAWRAYRNTECKRRQLAGGSDADATAVYSSCLVELMRVRVRELQM